jgi:hypothetical protein
VLAEIEIHALRVHDGEGHERHRGEEDPSPSHPCRY